jgi:hypothetical protein
MREGGGPDGSAFCARSNGGKTSTVRPELKAAGVWLRLHWNRRVEPSELVGRAGEHLAVSDTVWERLGLHPGIPPDGGP